MGFAFNARAPHYQKFNAQILMLGVLTGFSLWPHAWGNHLVDHGIPYARLVLWATVSGPVISTPVTVLTFEKSAETQTPSIGYRYELIFDNWITNPLSVIITRWPRKIYRTYLAKFKLLLLLFLFFLAEFLLLYCNSKKKICELNLRICSLLLFRYIILKMYYNNNNGMYNLIWKYFMDIFCEVILSKLQKRFFFFIFYFRNKQGSFITKWFKLYMYI